MAKLSEFQAGPTLVQLFIVLLRCDPQHQTLGGGGYWAGELTRVCGKSLHTLYPVA